MTELKADIKTISNSVNRWKGAGVVLLIIGAVFGFIVDMIYRLFDR
jgi:preprotein translocase subunit Sss1